MAQDRLANLDIFRGLAALAVCLYHFDRESFVGVGAISDILSYGHLGVDAFFVISGFVIPLSLYYSNFKINQSWAFIVSRFFRLYPAYFCSGAVAVILWYVSSWIPGFSGEAPSLSMLQLISNCLLLCDFTNQNWYIPVFWTLAIEGQYYLVIAVSCPLLFSSRAILRRGCLGLWLIAPVIVGPSPTVFFWAPLFVMGISAFLFKEGKVRIFEFLLLIILSALARASEGRADSAILSFIVSLCIVFLPRLRFPSLVWFGTISYSLYLIHLPLGDRMINLVRRLPEDFLIRLLAVGSALLVSVIAAAVLYVLVEKPSHLYARSARQSILNKANNSVQ